MDYNITITTPTEDRVYQVVDVYQPGESAPTIVTVRLRQRNKLSRSERMRRAVERVGRNARHGERA